MATPTIILTITLIVGFYMAWNIGANDTANSMSTAVGAKALTLKQAVCLNGFFCLIGAVLVGSHCTDTVRKGIVDPHLMGNPQTAMIGFFCVVVAASVWVTFATWRELPVSTTHSVVGAVMGVGIVSGGVGAVHWAKVWGIVASWVISPIFSGILAFLMFSLIDRAILRKANPIGFAKRYSFGFCFLTFFLICSSLLLKTPLGKRFDINTWTALLISSATAFVLAYIGYSFVKRKKIKNAEQIFRVLQVITSCYVGFAIGANDVANAIGPIAAVRSIAITGKIAASVPVPFYLLALGGIGIVIGTLTWGYKIIQTVGFKITELTNSRGFSIDFGAATSVLVASKFGLPVSTTHAVVGAVIGVGLARGIDAIDLRIIKNIVVSWVITLPAAAGLAVLVFKILR